jgi:hypothetical protein
VAIDFNAFDILVWAKAGLFFSLSCLESNTQLFSSRLVSLVASSHFWAGRSWRAQEYFPGLQRSWREKEDEASYPQIFWQKQVMVGCHKCPSTLDD